MYLCPPSVSGVLFLFGCSQSLPLRRPTKPQPREASWNVYILKMKPHEAMYQQFVSGGGSGDLRDVQAEGCVFICSESFCVQRCVCTSGVMTFVMEGMTKDARRTIDSLSSTQLP